MVILYRTRVTDDDVWKSVPVRADDADVGVRDGCWITVSAANILITVFSLESIHTNR